MSRPISEIQRDAAFRDLAEIRNLIGANEEELVQAAIKRLIAQRNNAWCQLRKIRDAIKVDSDESTLDEVIRVIAQRDRYKSDLEQHLIGKAA